MLNRIVIWIVFIALVNMYGAVRRASTLLAACAGASSFLLGLIWWQCGHLSLRAVQVQAALGVTGVEGGFRQGCEHILRVARHHSSTLSSLLQAILTDPLVTWAPSKQQASSKKVSFLLALLFINPLLCPGQPCKHCTSSLWHVCLLQGAGLHYCCSETACEGKK